MSDYLFMLENHLDATQNRVVASVQTAATLAGTTVWLTGGAMRDMLRGAPIRDLDFSVEHDAFTISRRVAAGDHGAEEKGRIIAEDPLKRWVELQFSSGARASISNIRTEKYLKPGGRPNIGPATIHEDLLRRDFTINAIALSLNRGSKGLLIDPTNGQADLQNHELRTTSSWSFFDDPVRLIRMIRLKHSLGFQVVPRTGTQFENAIAEEYHKAIPVKEVAAEIRKIASQSHIVPALDALSEAGILQFVSHGLAGEKRNSAGLAKLDKLAQTILPSNRIDHWLAFLSLLTEHLSTRERAEVFRVFELSKAQTDQLRHMDESVRKLEAALKSSKITKPSHVYDVLHKASLDAILLTLTKTTQRVIQDRIRAFYEKYLPLASEVSEEDVLATGAKPGTPKYEREKKALISQRLNARPKKAAEPEPIPAPPIIPAPMVRGARAR